jgi:3-isopropylmalate/(R)-2-methylmalate dehydratase small subunit
MSGRAWVFGDDVDTDAIAPGAWMKGGIEALAAHCLETHDPEFARSVKPGDILVAGRNFGAGSSREQAPQALKHLGVAAVIAESFAGLFYRNAINLGLPALVCPQAKRINAGARLVVDAEAGRLHDESSGEHFACEPIPPHLMRIIQDGGLLDHLARRLAREAAANEHKTSA